MLLNKEYLKKYKSNTLASGANQTYFISDGTRQTGRVYYKEKYKGEYKYSFLYTNIIDSTFADGSVSSVNELCGNWTIHSLNVVYFDGEKEIKRVPLTFDNKREKAVIPGEIFATDPQVLNMDGHKWCLEMEFSGDKIPYFEEIIINTEKYTDGKWQEDKRLPVPSMIGADLPVNKRVGFIGDSITEGIGTPKNAYSHWNAKIADLANKNYSYWNLGIGFARANDLATDGIWLEKAKGLDVVTVCAGVNDTCQFFTYEKTKENLKRVIELLKEAGVRTILFTVPPFDLDGEREETRKRLNNYIKEELIKITEVYDCCTVWSDKASNDNIAIYGGHPNSEGCLKLAQDFISKIEL